MALQLMDILSIVGTSEKCENMCTMYMYNFLKVWEPCLSITVTNGV